MARKYRYKARKLDITLTSQMTQWALQRVNLGNLGNQNYS